MSEGVRFRLEDTAPGSGSPDWVVQCDDEEWIDSLLSLLGETLHVHLVPPELELVGHQEIGDVWCVFASGAGTRDVVGCLVPSEVYGRFDLDPFVALPTWLGHAAPVRALNPDTVPEPTRRVVKPLDVREVGEPYLRFAYGYFLSCERALRTSTYWSVLPPGVPAKLSPLSCFAVDPPSSAELTLDELFGAQTQGRQHRTSSQPDWTALELERPEALLEPPLNESDGAAEGPDDDPGTPPSVAALSQRLRRLRQLWIASVVVLVLAGVGTTWGALRWGAEQLADVRDSSVPLSVLLEGLDLPEDGRAPEERIRAALRDLSTVSIQSGAWQEGLRSRGAEPEDVLGTLVDLSSLSTERIRRLVEAEDRVVGLAEDAATLGRLADAEGELQQLVTAQPSLTALASASDQLMELAPRSEPILKLADEADALGRLAKRNAALIQIARQQGDLEKLVDRAQVLATLADQAAGIVTFLERRQRALEALADRSEELVSLAEASASIRELVARQRTIERLVRSSSDLFAVAENLPLRQLAERRELLAQLERDLAELAALAENAPALLELVQPGSDDPASE